MASFSVSRQLDEVKNRVAETAARSGRSGDDIQLLAVTKNHSSALVKEAYDLGLRDFGENRVEEALPKQAELTGVLDDNVRWHMIGHIQSRKTTDIATNFPWVHSVERFKIARRLSETAVSLDKTLDILLEVNVSGEAAKSGYDFSGYPEVPLEESNLFAELPEIARLEGLRIRGLMTMAPYTTDPESVRPYFIRVREISLGLEVAFPDCDFSELSMGMSGDYGVAIEEGATIIRLGTAIFGHRDYG